MEFHGNDFIWNVIIFVVDNASSIHTDNRKNKLLVLYEGATCDINDIPSTAEKKMVLTLLK